MRDGWETATLAELTYIVKGSSPTQKTLPGEYPLVVTGSAPLSSNTYQFDGEAVCVPMVSSTGHGHASLKRVHYASGQFAVANIVSACVVKEPQRLSTKYLFHYLQHFKDDLIVTRMKGTANVSLSVGRLGEVPVAFPTFQAQGRFVDLIAAVDDVIEAAEAEADATANLLGSMLDEHLADASETREVRSLADGTRGLVGGPFGSSLVSADYRDEGVPVIRGTNMPRKGTKFVGGDFAFVSPDKADSLVGNQAIPGDVVFTQRGTIGQVGIVPTEPFPTYIVSQSQMRLRVDPELADVEYIRLLFTAPLMVEELVGQNRATANPHINLGVLASTRVPAIKLEQQRLHAARWLSVEDSFAAARATVASLHNLRANLLTALLSGEHVIPTTYDRFLEEAVA